MFNNLDDIVCAQKRGKARGITSVCSAHPWVLKAAMSRACTGTATQGENPVLIESTCNQVNQFGGYTGLTPADFAAYVHRLAEESAFPLDKLILGGDHLGPGPWQNEPADCAMQKAANMLRDYVQAGYTKLHLDASMRLGDDDPSRPLDVELSARRTAILTKVAEETLKKVSEPSQGIIILRYVIGSEVPTPGGATEHEEVVSVTKVEDARRTLEVTRGAFHDEGVESAWERVIALVVQPGVEFGDDFVLDYDSAAARGLAGYAGSIPFIYEAHSTDYQSAAALRRLVQDHFAILKVGPGLTFAFREAVFALALMEKEVFPADESSNLIDTLDSAMLADPLHWNKHYHGDERQLTFARKYSLSDRIRYYWAVPQVQSAIGCLLKNLGRKPIPSALISQFLPIQGEKIRNRQIENTPQALILDKVSSVLKAYALACG
jgi:D-tagatose-1,6-bisphosphate aldolase subunit GatZ/KbaZ